MHKLSFPAPALPHILHIYIHSVLLLVRITPFIRFVNDEDHAMAALGPVAGLPDYDWIRDRTIVRQ